MANVSVIKRTQHLRLSDPKCQFVNFNIKAPDGTLFPAHKVYLARNSQFFGEMFDNDKRCDVCEIKEHSPESIEVCLLYIYTNELRINPHNVCEVLALSNHWKMDTVTKRCESLLTDNLNPSNCIQMKKRSTKHSLYLLANASNAMILTNAYKMAKNKALGELSSDEIRSLRNTTPDDTKSFWMIFQAWAKFTRHKVCEATKVVPYGSFTINRFKNAVWKHDHIHGCEICKSIAAHQFLETIKEIPEETSSDDLLFLKGLAKSYGFEEVAEMTFAYIEQHPDFISSCLIEVFDPEELLARLANMKTECNQSIFNSLVQWMKNDPTRHYAFKFIFKYAHNPDLEPQSVFLSSIGTFVGLSEWCVTDASTDVDQNHQNNDKDRDDWFPQHSLFLKMLAKSYHYKRIERHIDECIVGDFARVSQLPEFINLSVDDMQKYVSSLPTYDYGAKPVWQAVMKWVNHDHERIILKISSRP